MIKAHGCDLKEGCGNTVDDKAKILDKGNSSRVWPAGRWLCLFAVKPWHAERSAVRSLIGKLSSSGREHCVHHRV